MSERSSAAQSEKDFWNVRGDELAASYDQLAEEDYDSIFQRWTMRPGATDLVLEIGSGTGAFGSRIQRRLGARIIGLDLAHAMLRHSSMPSVVSNGQSLPVPDATFDKIVGCAVLHHLPDLQKALAEIVRCLKPSGTCLFFEPNLWHPQRRLCMNTKWWCPGVYSPEEQALSPRKLPRLMLRSGFDEPRLGFFSPRWRNPGFAARVQRFASEWAPKALVKVSHSWFVVEARRR